MSDTALEGLVFVKYNDRWSVKCSADRGATTAEKLRGTKVWVPTPGPKARMGVEGGHPSRCEGPGVSPPKICENSDAKSCILVTTCCEISCFLKSAAKNLGDQFIVGPPT